MHIGIGRTVISLSDMVGLCSSRSGSPELTLDLIHNRFDNECLHLLISTVAFSKSLTQLDISLTSLSVIRNAFCRSFC